MVVTMLDNGVLLKPQTFDGTTIKPLFETDNKSEFGENRAPLTAAQREEDWADLANYPPFNGDKTLYKNHIKKSQDR